MKMFWLVSLFCVVALLAWAQFHKSAPHDVPPDNSNTAVSTAGGAPATQAPVPKVDDTPRTDCDILAADPDDPGRKADGVPLEQVKPQRAFDACTAALKQYPDSPRLRLQLGRAIERGEHWDKAATEYRKAAQAGYAPARNTLVCLYTGGHFVEGSRTQGIEWLRQAAEQGFAPAQRTLGRLYKEGRLESDDDARAAEWLHKAALQGDAFAQYEFGDMCRTGRGVAQSYAQAAEWFRKAAERGNAEAQYKLGMMHITGVGMAQDYVQAAGFLRKAAEGGQNNAQDYAEFLRKPAVRGQDNARMWLGLMHEHGLGVKKDYAKAIEWYRKTIEQLAPNRRPRYIEDRIRVVELKTIQQALLHTKRIPDRAPRTDCDILAADPDDPNRKAAGVAFAASDLKQAMNACQSATAKYPNSPRLHYQLARIYAMDSNAEQAAAEYRKAAKGGYAPALNSLASWCDGIYQDHAPLFRQWLTTADQGNIDAKKGLGDRCKGNDDYAQAAFWYREMADKGNAYGQYQLGHLYEKGNGVDEDLLQAIGYYRKAADQGYADAMKALGGMYEKARGVTRDVHQAIVWYQKAADLESGGAMDALARIYMQGDGVERDDAQAFEWIRRRADLQLNWEGDESDSARITLGRMYKLGHGTPRDYAKAVECYQKIADKRRSAVGEADYIGRRALHNLGRMYAAGYGVAKDCGKAIDLLREAAKGDEDAAIALGRMYAQGICVEKDYSQAHFWFESAGYDAVARYNIGLLYKNGLGVPEDYDIARNYFRDAAERFRKYADDHEDAFSQNALGLIYEQGYGLREDEGNQTQAMGWYQKAAALGNTEAQYNVGRLYENGFGVTRDFAQAAVWYEKAAEQGHADAMKALSAMYKKGRGVMKNEAKADEWLRKADAAGQKNASTKEKVRFLEWPPAGLG